MYMSICLYIYRYIMHTSYLHVYIYIRIYRYVVL